MGEKSKIEWTDASWNPIVGCSIVSPACTNCYAMAQAARIEAMSDGAGRQSHYAGTTQPSKSGPVWTGKLVLSPDHILTAPLRWKRPRRIFVNSMSDLFHEAVPDEWIDRVFAVMALAPQHTFQVLTKRAKRMREYLKTPLRRDAWAMAADPMGDFSPLSPQEYANRSHFRVPAPTSECFRWEGAFSQWPRPNVWLGVTAEDQTCADERIYDLLKTPAAKRFVSCEPLLGPLSLIDRDPIKLSTGVDAIPKYRFYVSLLKGWGAPGYELPGLDWVIAGGESGPNARPSHPDWFRSLRDQCAAADVPFFFKQWGSWAPIIEMSEDLTEGCYHPAPEDNPECSRRLKVGSAHMAPDGHATSLGTAGRYRVIPPDAFSDPRSMTFFHIGKRRAGSLLDGREHKEFPA